MKKYFGTAAIVVFNKKLLLMLRDAHVSRLPSRWALIGGKIDGDELPLETMKRELLEEINVLPSMVTEVGEFPFKDNLLWAKFYFCLLTEKEYRLIKKGSEGEKIGFFNFDEVLNMNVASLLMDKPDRLVKLKDMVNLEKPININ